MSVTQALNTAAAGLRTAQAGLSIVAANVANAQTPGYTRKSLQTQTTGAGGDLVSVRIASVSRELDQYLQKQLRTESSGGAYADLKAQIYQRLQQIYGDPNSASSLETVFSDFTTAVQALVTSPSDSSARINVLNTAQVLAQQLQNLTADIQSLRSATEQGIADSVEAANNLLQGIAAVNGQLRTSHVDDAAKASLLDQRDHYLDQLAELMDIRVIENESGAVSVFTSSGLQLAGTEAAVLSFDLQGMMTAAAQWSADPDERHIGTITLSNLNGAPVDLIATKSFRSGRIAAYLEMRDQVLVQAQAQLDEFAAAMSRALSDRTVAGTPATAGTQVGFDIDVGGLLAGNSVQVTYTDTLTNAQHKVTIVRVDDPNALPLSNGVTADPNDRVIGIDWSGGMASVVSQLNASFNGQIQFANPSGSILRILDDGTASTSDINAVSATSTVTGLSAGSAELPFFVDGGVPFSGAINKGGAQSTGYAGRIVVNPALLADPSKVVAYQASTPAGDQTRPSFILDQLTTASLGFSPGSGIGSASTPYTGTLSSFMRQAMSQQGNAAASAQSLSEGQRMVVDALQQRFNEGAAVNIDQEMSNLLVLQTAYGANARVFSAVHDMIDTLLQIL
ncbi:MAG: flagellar hook-associated protein FlgK [Xanthobacteraceae bacterium]